MSAAADRRRAMRVAAEHLAKMAIELTGAVHTMAEHIDDDFAARWDVEAISARVALDAIKREMADLEALLATPLAEAA